MRRAIGMQTSRVTGDTNASSPPPTPVCVCGQDLDVARGKHCPRCGTTLSRAVQPEAA
jgi:hypothetical protein